MRKLSIWAFAFALASFMSSCEPSFAASSVNAPLSVSASVDSTLTMNIAAHKNSSTGAGISSIDFGELVDLGTGTLRSSATGTTGTGNATVMVTVNSHGLPYIITETGSALSNGSVILPPGACTVVSVYSSADNGGAALPTGANLGTAGSWVDTNKILYRSESGVASMKTFQAIFSITDDPSAGSTSSVPLNQEGGSYVGTITLTATA